ncbi:MAG: hypothetical protein KC419_25395, partial [Anaerolineales bacterium]|nr:hypothetical protein [Anaerolineales bacterium]
MKIVCSLLQRVVKGRLFLGLLLLVLMQSQPAAAQFQADEPGATITGTIVNGTTGEPLAAGLSIHLYVYNSSYTQTETFDTILAADGSYVFDVSDQPAGRVYMVGVTYNDLEFTSDIGTIDAVGSTLSLPVTIYEQTTNAAAVVVDQLQISLVFVDGEVQVHELYSFDNRETAVYIGNTPDVTSGTVAIVLPDDAQAPTFQRGIGPGGGYIPANEMIQSGSAWYDTTPLRPGATSLTLLATYRLPYREALTFAHDLPYAVETVSLALPYNDVTFNSSGWQQLASQSTGSNGGVIRNYSRDGLDAGAVLTIGLSGAPTLPAADVGRQSPVSVDTAALLLSVAVLLTAVTFIIRLIILKRSTAPQPEEGAAFAESEPSPTDLVARSRRLITALTILDEGYDKGWIDEPAYQYRRQHLKDELQMIQDQLGLNVPADPQTPFPIP